MNRFFAALLALVLCMGMATAAQAYVCQYYQANGNHDWSDAWLETPATCTNEGVMMIVYRDCGELGVRVLPRNSHVYGDWRISRQPTDCEMGQRSRICQACGYAQLEEVWPEDTVHKGTRDANAICALQELLVQGGYLSRVTGVYDEATEQAVRAVQREAGFNVNGTAWPQTIEYLQGRVGVRSDVPATTPAGTTAPAAAPTPAPAQTTAPQAGYTLPAGEQQPWCTYVELATGVTAVVYCPVHQTLLDNCETMLSFAQTDALRVQALQMYRMMWETELAALYQAWGAQAATEDERGMVISHQAMFTSYLSMQESTWKRMYGAGDLRVQEQVIAALMQQCADVCMMIGMQAGQ